MRMESGRSLVELIGVLAIGGVLAAGSIAMYRTIKNNQTRIMASAKLKQLANDTKLLLQPMGTYDGVSVEYLVKSGALKNTDAPIGGNEWSVTPNVDGASFSINLVNLTNGECAYFSTMLPEWATSVSVNGYLTDAASHCFSTATNNLTFVVQ